MKIQYKILIIVLALIIVNKTIVASEPDKKVIEQVAVNFFENLIRLDKSNKSLKVLDIIEHKMNNITCYYTVNFVDDGYVNVSATYAAKPIISYSLNGKTLSDTELPPAYIEWMDNYKNELYDAIIYKVDDKTTIDNWNEILNNTFISRLTIVNPLTTSVWGQSVTNDGECPGFNALAPAHAGCDCDHCSSGCVAIAMAQILYYWKHPLNVGFYTFYDWCNMNDALISLNNQNFNNELDAISNLVYDCAESVDMDFCLKECESGAYLKDVVNPFKDSSVWSFKLLDYSEPDNNCENKVEAKSYRFYIEKEYIKSLYKDVSNRFGG